VGTYDFHPTKKYVYSIASQLKSGPETLMQEIQIEPDLAIPFPDDDQKLANFIERAQAACNTAQLLELDTTPTDEDLEVAETIAYAVAGNEDKVNRTITTAKASNIKPATYHAVNDILKEFSTKVVDNATQIRLLVTNKLLLESVNEDPRIRIRALELLGKITDVGLFTEKSEVTINHRSNKELVESLRSKIHRLMTPTDVEDVKAVEVNGEKVDIDAELGIEDTEPTENTDTPTENDADDKSA